MPSIQCVCGTRFTAHSTSADGTVYCPSCGQALAPANQAGVAKSPVTQPSYSGGVSHHGQFAAGGAHFPMASQEPNQTAIVGFVLAMVSLFGCLFLAPFALFVSIKGMKGEKDRGLAIAGVVIGAIQSVALLFVVGYFVVVFVMIGSVFAVGATAVNQAMKEAEKIQTTEVALDDAYNAIQNFHNENGRWPNETEGQKLTSEFVDGWGNEIVWDDSEPNTWRVVSTGADGQQDTFDDHTRDYYTFNSIEDTQILLDSRHDDAVNEMMRRFSPEFDSVEEALAAIASGGSREKGMALEWLAEAQPSDEWRSEVVRTMLGLFDNLGDRRAAIRVIREWADEDEFESLVEYLDRVEPFRGNSEVIEMIAILEESGQVDWLVKLANHPDNSIRDRVRGWLRTHASDPSLLIGQCVSDLEVKERRKEAADWLSVLEVLDEERDRVSQGLNPLLTSGDYTLSRAAQAALRHWGPTPQNIDALAQLGDYELLGQIQHPKVLEKLGEMLKKWPIETRKAAEQMRKIGPPAESYVWPVLEERNHIIVLEALRLLGEIGTERSVPKIEALTDNRLVKGQAEATLQQIRLANRTPSEWSASEQP